LSSYDFHDIILRGDRFVVKETRRVLSRGACVIDAGCGIGATVYDLSSEGLKAYDIDNC
jgi:hypothetical protein